MEDPELALRSVNLKESLVRQLRTWWLPEGCYVELKVRSKSCVRGAHGTLPMGPVLLEGIVE